ncbi:DUF4932 domain-containing protein [Riemerella anatipestifer]|nr:DUF4932 domain-containing protein [Riemerella anatipestifer]
MIFIQNVFGQKSKMNISIDEKIETLYAVAFLNNYFLVSPHDNLYKWKLKNDYKELKNHKAVTLFDELSKKHNFNGYKIVHWILQFDTFPALNELKKVADPFPFVKPENEELLVEFKKELLAFNNEPMFRKYWDEIQEYNIKVTKQVEKSPTIQHLPTYLEEYYGKKLKSYNLILSPLLHTGGFNAEMLSPQGQKEVYAIVGPNGEIDFIPYFDKDYIETDMILHEFGHSFVNPITDKYDAEIEKLKSKYYTNELKETGKKQGYNEWKYVFNELLLRATTIKIAEKYFGKEVAKANLQQEISAGFGLVENMVKILDEYEQNRKKYPTFDMFCPVLIDRMK